MDRSIPVDFWNGQYEQILIVESHRSLYFTWLLCLFPELEIIFVSNGVIDPSIVQYYFDLSPQPITWERFSSRFIVVPIEDPSKKPLVQKILDNQEVILKLQSISKGKRVCMTVWRPSSLELELESKLGIPLITSDSSAFFVGTKSGSHAVFAQADLPFPKSTQVVHSSDDLAQAIYELFLKSHDPSLYKNLIIKLDGAEMCYGMGNAMFDLNELLNDQTEQRPSDVLEKLKSLLNSKNLVPNDKSKTWEWFISKMSEGTIAEEFIESFSSPSGQALIHADEAMLKIGHVLVSYGVRGRFACDFVASGTPEDNVLAPIEINLRYSGTSFPQMITKLLCGANYHLADGFYHDKNNNKKYWRFLTFKITYDYCATNLVHISPQSLISQFKSKGLFDKQSLSGVVLFMLSQLTHQGKCSFVVIGNSDEETNALLNQSLQLLQIIVS